MIRACFLVRIAAGVLLPAVLILLPQPNGAAEPPAKGEEPFEGSAAFLKKHCLACHSADDPSGNLDLGALTFNAADRESFARWVRIHDRVQAGEMPPPQESQPDAKSAASFVKGLAETLTKKSEQANYARNGRATLRRLNRYEYENAVRDLLNVPWAEIKEKLPDDGEAHRFNKTGGALDVSYVQMARYMSSAEYAMHEAIRAAWQRPESTTRRYYARDESSLVGNFRPRENGTLPDRHSFPVLDSAAQPDVRAGREPVSSTETREREAVGRVSSIFSDAGGYSWGQFRAPVAGEYRLRFKGYTIWVSGGGISRWYYEGFGDEKAPVYYLPLWHRPNLDEVWPGRTHEPMSVFAQSAGQRRMIGEFDFSPEPTESEMTVLLRAGEVVSTDGSRLFRARVNGTGEQYVNPLATEHGMPGYAIQWMEVEGPLAKESAEERYDAGYRLLFGELPLKIAADGAMGISLPAMPAERGGRGGRGGVGGRGGGAGGPVPDGPAPGQRGRGGPPGGPGFRGGFAAPRPTIVEVVSENPDQDAERLLRGFLKRAYRRPPLESEIALYLDLFQKQYAQGFGFAKSLIAAYTAVLSSPGFLFVEETPGKLSQRELATRLALFLWNSPPDALLRELAERGALDDPVALRAETERMLDDPKSRRFVEAFTDYWLDLREIDDNSPSTTLYNDYELDDPLKLAAVEETRLFVAELLKEDLSARNIVDSDFTFLNERLARHYGIEGIAGTKMRKVALDEKSVRGGLMTQASVLKVTANGTTTSPVLRGVWITERILGFETPPPPPVPAVEPDIRGAVTIRQQIEAHRADASCAACHARLDPPGMALESFDVMGAWRERYRAVNEEVPAEKGIGLDGQRYKFHYALAVDPSGQLLDGRPFADVRQLKQLLLEDEPAIARNLVQQLTIYATGAPIGFSDRQEVEAILSRTRPGHYGVRSLVHEIVGSKLFQYK
jgi:mono/diheme cytochrome c family protein